MKKSKGREEVKNMVLDQFRFLTDSEIEKKISEFWDDLEYLKKIKILLLVYPDLNITKIEFQGIDVLWKEIPLERKKDIYQGAWKY
jgi:hypothetical protein